jgi:hypoxanthine phosphoribosyltransferase
MIKKNDIKPLLNEDELKAGIKALADKLNEKYKDEEVYLICVLKGSVMFMADLAKHLTMPVKMEFIRLSSYGSGTTSSGKVNAVDIKFFKNLKTGVK